MQEYSFVLCVSMLPHKNMPGINTEGDSNLLNNKVESLLNQTQLKSVTVQAAFAMWGNYSQTVAPRRGDSSSLHTNTHIYIHLCH